MVQQNIRATQQSANTVAEIQRYFSVLQFYNDEANLLDSHREEEWLTLLADNFQYKIPVRSTQSRGAGWDQQFSTTAFHMNDDKAALGLRVKRLQTGFAFAEDPPSRTRHFVSNLRIEAGTVAGEYATRVNILLTRGNPDLSRVQILSAERLDTLREISHGWQLIARTVLLDHTVVPTNNLAVIF